MTDTSTQPGTLDIPPIPGGKDEGIAAAKPSSGMTSKLQSRIIKTLRYSAYRAFRLSGEFTAIVLGLALFWVAALNVVLARGSVDISFLDKNAGLWFSQAFDGQDASVGKMTLDWNPAGDSVILRANDVSVTDDQGREVQHISLLTSEVGITRILSGQLDPRRLYIKGGAVTWRRDAEGRVKAGLGTPETVGKLGPVWTGRAAEPRERGVFSLGGLETVTIDDAVAYIHDEKDGLELQFSDTFIDVNNVGDVFEFEGQTSLIIGDDGAPLTAELVLSPDLQDFDFKLGGQNLNPNALAPERGRFASLRRLNAPMDFDLRIVSERDVGLSRVDVDVVSNGGRLDSPLITQAFDKAVLKARYDPVSETLNFSDVSLQSDKFELTGIAGLSNIGTPANGFFTAPSKFSVDLSEFKLDARPQFDRAFDLESVSIAGVYSYEDRQTNYEKIQIDFGPFQTDMSGRVVRVDGGIVKHLKLDGRINGVMSPEDLLGLWPSKFALGARNWIDRAILKADLSNFQLALDIPEEILETGKLSNEHLDLTFDINKADVKYISTMTPLTNGAGRGRLRGNAFELVSNQGQVGALTIDKGVVNIPRLSPKGGDLLIDINGHGNAADMMALIDQKPFGFATRYGVNPAEFSGEGKINLKISRPLLVNFDKNRIQYNVNGTFENVSAPFSMGAHKVTNGNITLKTDKYGLRVEGPIKFGPWDAQLNWQEIFDDGATPSMFKLKGKLDRDDLDSFGIGFREYFTGDMMLSVDARGNGIQIIGADIEADLTNADIQAGAYWKKDAGVPGDFKGVLSRTQNGAISLKNMAIDAPGLTIRGGVNLADNLRLINLDLTETKIDNFIDARVKAKPDLNDTRFSVILTGDYLDISPFVAKSMSRQSSGDMDVPILLTGDLKSLALKPDYKIDGARVLFAHDGTGISQARLRGNVAAGPFIAEMTTNESARIREVMIDVPDASAAAKSFFGMDNIKGGHLIIEAGLPLTGEIGPLQGLAEIDEFTLVKAPALAQMLSMGSLRGLGDTLGGTGIDFTRFEVPFSMIDGQFSIRDARVSGPAMGLTGDGDVNFDTKMLDFDGVLVPAYSANSILGSVPLIGDLLIGKKGEGMFALTYTVKGTFDQTQVAVNPLSALTPGFLRGIFKPSRKDLPDAEIIKEIEAVKPPKKDK